MVYSDSLWLKNMQSYPGKLNVGFSYMPLAFITDRHTVYTALWNGGRVGILTRTPPGCSKAEQIFADLQAVRPTVLKGVPTFWERVVKASRMVHDTQLQILGGRASVLLCGAGALETDVGEYVRSRWM